MKFTINQLKSTIQNKIFLNFANLSIIQLSNILLMMLIFPVLTRIIGFEKFGQVMVANAFAGLMGIWVNYGTIQTSIKEVAVSKNNRLLLSRAFVNTLAIRLLLFIPVLILLVLSGFILDKDYHLYLLTLPLIFAEVLNPLFFFLGIEDLKMLNLANLFSKVITLLLVLFFIKGANDAVWVNFIMGSVLAVAYLLTLFWAIKKHQIEFVKPTYLSQKLILKNNFYLLANNFSVHLQQSFMLFALQRWSTAAWLGAYSLCDKIIWSSRLLIISISNASYPTAAQLFDNRSEDWKLFKQKVRFNTGILFLFGSIVLFLFPELIIYILAGKANVHAALFLKEMAFIPFIASLNFLNVLDRLLNKDNFSIFKIAIILLVIAGISSYLFTNFSDPRYFGFYPLITELAALFLYEYYIRKQESHG